MNGNLFCFSLSLLAYYLLILIIGAQQSFTFASLSWCFIRANAWSSAEFTNVLLRADEQN